jgi:HNH endonuclease
MSELTHKRLLELLHYDPATGVLSWKVERRTGKGSGRLLRAAGSRAGCWHSPETTNRKLGWRSINIDRHLYREARIIWFWMTGKWPDRIIDHKDGNPANQQWSNLRLATDRQNKANSATRKDNVSGLKGVRLHSSGRYTAFIGHRYLGYFDTAEEAHAAYSAAAVETYGEFARHE